MNKNLLYQKSGIHISSEVIHPPLISASLIGTQNLLNDIYDTGQPPWGTVHLSVEKKLKRIVQPHLASQSIRELLTQSNLGKEACCYY